MSVASMNSCWHSVFMDSQLISTNEKALSINNSKKFYGTFAEIGAGQEIARWFFKVGGASGTIAKAISAYDMTFSDAIYGPEKSGRYVVESRVQRMIDYEYDLLESRLQAEEHKQKRLFTIANTVAAKSPKYKGDCHGWVGIKFQTEPGQEANEIVLHIRLLDPSNRQQQAALGIFGVNLLYAAVNFHDDIPKFLKTLVEGDLESRIQVNTMRLRGPIFKNTDIYKANLQLVISGLSPALLVCSNGEVSHLDEELYHKEVLIHRAAFNPITCSDMDMLKSARDHFCSYKTDGVCAPFLLSEIHSENLKDPKVEKDILHRLRMLLLAQQNVLITNIQKTYELNEYLEIFSREHINFVYPAKKLIDIFEENEFPSLESLTRIFKEQTRMFFYPTPVSMVDSKYIKDTSQDYFTVTNYKPTDKNIYLFQHLVQKSFIEDIKEHHCDPSLLISDADLQKKVQAKDKNWKKFVPDQISKYIEKEQLFTA